MPRGKPIVMVGRDPVVPRGTDYAPLIEAMTAQTEAITKLAEAMHAVAVKLTHPMMVMEPAGLAGAAGPHPPIGYGERLRDEMVAQHKAAEAEMIARHNAEVRAKTKGNRLVPRYGDEPAQTIDRENTNKSLADLAQEMGLYEEEPMPEPDTDGMWRTRLQMWGMKLWQPDWGPQPGQQGCEVPAYLLNGRSR